MPEQPDHQTAKNVHDTPLRFFTPKEGFYKDGYCRTSASDDNGPRGNYSIAATLTHGFLQSEYGDDPPYKGHSAGRRMCISAHDFFSAIKELGPGTAPKVHLEATDKRALEVVDLKTLRRYAAKSDAEVERESLITDVGKTGKRWVKERLGDGGKS